jgi:uncharacterized protein (DUF983 family)
MFRCPHCRERAIGFWAKLKDGACPRCGGKYALSAWALLPALAVQTVALFVPSYLALAGPESISVDAMWWLLAAGVALGLVVSLPLYALIAPLYRRGSPAARRDGWSYLGVIGIVALYAALNGSRADTIGVKKPFEPAAEDYSAGSIQLFLEPELQEELKAALKKAGVPFTLEKLADGRESLRMHHHQLAAYRRVERELWGEPPPHDGRSVHFASEAMSKEFQRWLSGQGIPHRVMTYQRQEYVVWEGEPHLWKKFHAERPSDCAKPRAQLEASKRC